MNRYRHEGYRPEWDVVFGRLLYREVVGEAERLIGERRAG